MKFHLFVRHEDGKVTELTTGENERTQFLEWSEDGNSFFYSSNKRDPKYMDVYEMDTTSYQSTLIYKNTKGYEFAALSSDKSKLALLNMVNENNTNMYIYNRISEELKCISEHEGDIKYYPQVFSSDGKSLYFLSDEDSEFLQLKKKSLQARDIELVACES